MNELSIRSEACVNNFQALCDVSCIPKCCLSSHILPLCFPSAVFCRLTFQEYSDDILDLGSRVLHLLPIGVNRVAKLQ